MFKIIKSFQEKLVFEQILFSNFKEYPKTFDFYLKILQFLLSNFKEYLRFLEIFDFHQILGFFFNFLTLKIFSN